MRSLLIFILLAGTIVTGCGGGKSEGPEEPVKIIPDAAVLTFPEKDAICITGTGGSATQSTVVFKWNAAKNAEGYNVSVKNLITGELATQSSDKTELAITISRGTPYSWFVISKSKDGSTVNSVVWKFYNSDEGKLSFPPFPADQMSPAYGAFLTPENGKVKLSWKGSDADNDIADYDVYFGILANPPLLKAVHSSDNLPEVNVAAKTKYYWKIVTRDAKGNTSESEILQFSTN